MLLQNVSSVVREQGSDIDAVVWCSDRVWRIINRLVVVQNSQVPVQMNIFGLELDLFLAPKSIPGKFTMGAVVSRTIQESWDADTITSYRAAKGQIAHLRGKERKLAKIELAKRFGLPTVQYTWVK